jgi:hypothetical protein
VRRPEKIVCVGRNDRADTAETGGAEPPESILSAEVLQDGSTRKPVVAG